MNTASGRLAYLSAAAIAALSCSAGALAAPSQKALEVLGARQPPAANVQLPPQAKANSAVFGQFNEAALDASKLELTLADGTKITARLQRVARDDRKGVQSWVGTFDDSPGSVLVLSRAKGVVTGVVNYKEQVLEIVPAAGGKHLLFAVDATKVPKSDHVKIVPTAGDAATDQGYGQLGAITTNALPASGVVQDLLVVYTAASAARYGQAGLESMIQNAVQAANQAYLNSQIGITLNVVGMAQTTVTEGSSMDAALNGVIANSAVASLRNQLGADIVMAISENGDYCGTANLMTSNSTSFAPNAYGIVYSSCLSNQSLAHEIGHIQGLMHDRANSGYGGVYPYSYGFARCTSDGTGFRDIMSYPCSGAPRVLVFSNPYVNWNGYPTGIAYESNPGSSAENARSLINTATTVAAFRTSSSAGTTPTAPAAPSSMAVRSNAYNGVSLGWVDNSTNESGFKLERSGDGVNFSEIATLGTDATSFADGSVAARSTYYYRVRAFNSVGGSGFSNTVGVTTPDVPPPPPVAPSSVSARDNGDGSASASWAASTGTVTSYEVRREKWDSRRATWGSSTIAATVPASVLTIADQAGTGTYRYFVVAANAGGRSAAAGPASVTVTGATSTTIKGRGRNK
jgi:hypothetical protein